MELKEICHNRHIDANYDEKVPDRRDYVFIPDGAVHFIDPEGLNDHLGSQFTTESWTSFDDAV